MGLMDKIRGMFGSGKARFSVITTCSREYGVKMPYEGIWDEDEAKRLVCERFVVETGLTIKSCTFVGRYED